MIGFNTKAAPTPQSLVEEALAGFQQAAENLATAQAAIETQKAGHEAKRVAAEAAVNDCVAQSDRLGRVSQRIQDLLA